MIELLPPTTADDDRLVHELTDLVNRVYATAEAGLWADGMSRTSPDDMRGMLGAGEVAVARVEGRVAGCVHIHQVDDTTGLFGMLAADPAHRGEGLGRALVDTES